MVAVAQLVESWIVIPVVVGSSPISHPIFMEYLIAFSILMLSFTYFIQIPQNVIAEIRQLLDNSEV